jgi:hypothetical protein
MARPNPKGKKGESKWMDYSHELSDKSYTELVSLLGHNTENPTGKKEDEKIAQAMVKVQNWLGFHKGGVEGLDNAPRPSDYRAIFKKINKQTINLFRELTELNSFYREQFSLEGKDLAEIEIALATIIDVSTAVEKKYEGQSSKGAPSNVALMKVILNLRGIFRKNYRGQKSGRKTRGAVTKKSAKEIYEIKFVETALLDARIIPKKDSYQTVQRHFKDPRCIPE